VLSGHFSEESVEKITFPAPYCNSTLWMTAFLCSLSLFPLLSKTFHTQDGSALSQLYLCLHMITKTRVVAGTALAGSTTAFSHFTGQTSCQLLLLWDRHSPGYKDCTEITLKLRWKNSFLEKRLRNWTEGKAQRASWMSLKCAAGGDLTIKM